MGWNWVNDLFAPEGKKKSMDWDARCPYGLCPGNIPLNRKEVILFNDEPILKKPRLKFNQKISPLIYQYKCGYCGCLTNFGVETPTERGLEGINPALSGGKADYKFHV